VIIPPGLAPLAAAALVALGACAHAMPAARSGPLLDALFAPPSAAEIAAVEADWASRDTRVHDFRVEHVTPDGASGRTMVVSHVVDGARHYGAIRVPDGAAGPLPVLVIGHGGDSGATGYHFIRSGPLAHGWIQVLPSFRGEPLHLTPLRAWRSGGTPSPWDGDVDDAIALLNAALAHVPQADSTRIAAFGRSRGGGVMLLMAVRDPRIKAVVSAYGPTDFLLPEVRRLAGRALGSRVARLPGAGYLADSVLFALRDGRTTVPQARMQLLRRSPAWFARRLPPAQVHHGVLDRKVSVDHGDRLDEAMRGLGRDSVSWRYFRYPRGGHRFSSFPGALPRTEEFLSRAVRSPRAPR
jgi:dipeptidyl aminopeptidase/acylaminoacyl peptidase